MTDLNKPPHNPQVDEAQNGGERPGAGRKINSQGKQTLSGRELREKLMRSGETPLEVMVDGMRKAKGRFDKLEAKLEAIDLNTLDADTMKALGGLIGQAKAHLIEARNCAKEAAPYLHQKLEPTGRHIAIELPTIKTADDIAEGQGKIMEAVASGQLTTEEGAKFSGILEARRKAIETSELMRRIEAIEAQKR